MLAATSASGRYVVRLLPADGAIPTNRHFELDLWVFDTAAGGTAPVSGLRVGVNARMPEHGHGTLRLPRVSARADGGHHVEGLLLHMGGYWQLYVDVGEEDELDRVQFDLVL